MLTAKDVQDLLQVDRSTIYRMAEDGRLPAIKVGRQWRFPEEQIQQWLGGQEALAAAPAAAATAAPPALAAQMPLDCVQLIQDTFADAIGVMAIFTDMDGNPVTRVSNPCGLFAAVEDQAMARCVEQWRAMAADLNLEPAFTRSQLGLLCARGLVRVGSELKGMVFVGGIAPDDWPPTAAGIERIAADLDVPAARLAGHIDEVYRLDRNERARVLGFAQKLANIVSHILQERTQLMGRLNTIASLTRL